MPRIRTLKPEFWSDEKLAGLPAIDRLVFLGLISHADDAGRLVDSVKQLDGLIFPDTDESSRDSLDTLARLSRIIRYVSPSGQKLIQIANWLRHQRVDHPSPHVLPGPREMLATPSRDARAPTSTSTSTSTSTEEEAASTRLSRDLHEELATLSRENAYGPTTGDVVGLIRSARSPRAVLRSIQMLAQERPALAPFIGPAAVEFAASGEAFNARLFAGYVRDAERRSKGDDNGAPLRVAGTTAVQAFEAMCDTVEQAGGYRSIDAGKFAEFDARTRAGIKAMGGLAKLAQADEIGRRMKRKDFERGWLEYQGEGNHASR